MAIQPELFVKMTILSWDTQVKRADKLFNGLSDEAFLEEIAPGKNRIIYLLGHLAVINDRMLPLLGLGQSHYPQWDAVFLTNPDKSGLEMPSVQELRKIWTESNNRLTQSFNKMKPGDWFQKHQTISEEDFAKEPHRNKLSVLMTRTNHLAYHLGQIVLVNHLASN